MGAEPLAQPSSRTEGESFEARPAGAPSATQGPERPKDECSWQGTQDPGDRKMRGRAFALKPVPLVPFSTTEYQHGPLKVVEFNAFKR